MSKQYSLGEKVFLTAIVGIGTIILLPVLVLVWLGQFTLMTVDWLEERNP